MFCLILLAGLSNAIGSSEPCGMHSDAQINVCRSNSELSLEEPTPCSSPETGDGITVIDGLLSDSERGNILDDLPLSKQPRGETYEIDAPEGLAHGISMGFLEAETGARRRAKQIEKLRDGARSRRTSNASMNRTSLFATAQSFSVGYHRERGYDGHVALLYIGGTGMLEFMSRASNNTTLHSVDIVPGRMVAWHNNKWSHRAIASNQTRVFLGLHSRGRGRFSSITISAPCMPFVCPSGTTKKSPPPTCAGPCTSAQCCDAATTTAEVEATTTAGEATTTAGEATTTAGVEATTTAGGEATTTAGGEATTTVASAGEATTTAGGEATTTAGAAGASTTASPGANTTGIHTGYEFCTTAAACFFTAYTEGTHYKIHKSSGSYPAASCAADCVADTECEAFESLSGGVAPSCSFWKSGACDIQAGTSPGPPGYTTSIPYVTFCDKNGARRAFTPVVGKCRESPSLGLSSVALTAVFLATSRFDR